MIIKFPIEFGIIFLQVRLKNVNNQNSKILRSSRVVSDNL